MKILIIDDEIHALSPWIDELELEGHTVVASGSIMDACRRLYLPSYSLIILDRLMPLSELFGGDRLDVDAGQRLFQRMRRFPEYGKIPVLVFTNNYDDSMASNWERSDKNVLVRSKSLKPRELANLVRDWAEPYGFSSEIPTVPDDEHPNVAPYYMRNLSTGKSELVYFEPCSPEDADWIDETAKWDNWHFGDVFRDLIGHEDASYRLQKVVALSGKDEAYGLYLLSGPEEQALWYRDIIFETSPRHIRTNSERQYREIGLVFVARFLRECLVREGVSDEFKKTGVINLHDGSIRLTPAVAGRDFLLAIGFEATEGREGIFTIRNERAQEILRKAHSL